MKHAIVPVLMLVASTLPTAAAAGERSPIPLRELFRVVQIQGSITVPPEWDGIWSVVDSTYDCTGTFESTSTSQDTLCQGAEIVPEDELPVAFSCSGSATATTVDVTCSGTMEIVPNCDVTFTFILNGTRTGDTYFVVNTQITDYMGTAIECTFFPDDCTQINNHGTRTAPAPPDYCSTPTLPSSWGELKVRYR